MKRVSHQDSHTIERARAAQVLLGAPGVFRIAVRVEDPAARSHGARQPQRGVANRRTHLEHAARLYQSGQLVEQAAARGSDDRHVIFCGVPLHLAQHAVAGGKQRIHVLLRLGLRESLHRHSPGQSLSVFQFGVRSFWTLHRNSELSNSELRTRDKFFTPPRLIPGITPRKLSFKTGVSGPSRKQVWTHFGVAPTFRSTLGVVAGLEPGATKRN